MKKKTKTPEAPNKYPELVRGEATEEVKVTVFSFQQHLLVFGYLYALSGDAPTFGESWPADLSEPISYACIASIKQGDVSKLANFLEQCVDKHKETE